MEQRQIDNAMDLSKNELWHKCYRPYDDCLIDSVDVEGRYLDKVGAHETRRQNEVMMDRWELDSEVTHHVHHEACESFYLISGSAALTLPGGKRIVLRKGDIFHCPAGMGHEFHTLEQGTVWYTLFSNIHYYTPTAATISLSKYFPDLLSDVKFFRAFEGKTNSRKLDPYPPIREEITEHYQVRHPGQALISYEAKGIQFNLKVGLWETNEKNEIWEMVIPAGTTIEIKEPYEGWQTYIIEAGEVDCVVGDEVFTAKPDDIIQVHSYTPCKFVFHQEAKVLNFGSMYKLYELLEQVTYRRNEDPDVFRDEAAVRAILEAHKLPMFEIHA